MVEDLKLHSKTGWIKNNLSWVENAQTQQWGCLNQRLG